MPQVAVQPRRTSWIVAIVVAIVAVITTAAISIASPPSTDEIVLNLSGSNGSFVYGGDTQAISTTSSPCRLSDDSIDGPIVEIGATTYEWRGGRIPGYGGLKDGNMGVNKAGGGYSHYCQKIDYVKDGQSEELTLNLGELPLSEGKLITDVDLRFRVWADAKVKVEYLVDGSPIGSDIFELDARYGHYYIDVHASADGALFDGIRLSMNKGSAGLTSPSVLHLSGTEAAVQLDVKVDGDGAGPVYVPAGTPIPLEYVVTNTGDQELTNIVVTDAAATGIDCSSATTPLLPGDSTSCTGSIASAIDGLQTNSASVIADGEYGYPVDTATDDAEYSYFGSAPDISIDVTTNGSDGQYLAAGSPITFEYAMTNSGNVDLDISLSDSVLGSLDLEALGCPTSLAAGASYTCEVAGTAEESEPGVFYMNEGTVTGTPPVGSTVDATDDSSYFGFLFAYVYSLENNGPVVVEGDPVIWTFTIENTGNVPIPDATLLQANVGEGETPISCTVDPLDVGETDSCTVSIGSAAEGEQTVEFVIITTDPNGEVIQSDPIEDTYFGGLACGAATDEGDPGAVDLPYIYFANGPASSSEASAEKPNACNTPVSLSVSGPEGDTLGTASAVAPAGQDFGPATGVITVEWDAVLPSQLPLQVTKELIGETEFDIPSCEGPSTVLTTPIVLPGGQVVYQLVNPLTDEYPSAVPAGRNVCEVLRIEATVIDGGVQLKQLTQVFYFNNDPKFVRK